MPQRRYAIAALLLLALLLQYRLWLGDGGYLDHRKLTLQVREQEAEVERLQARNEALQAEVNDLKSGMAAIEERARSDLGMIKPGETFYLITPHPGQ